MRGNVIQQMQEHDQPKPISAAERRSRLRRSDQICRRLGFVGRIEYRHVYSRTGGAQYCVGPSTDSDLLVLHAEAFERDADPDDFSLEALIAHECGHQLLIRRPDLQTVLAKFQIDPFEEILASLVGSLLLDDDSAAQTLVWKATAELGQIGMSAEATVAFVERLRRLLRNVI